MGSCFLATYHPLVETLCGCQAEKQHNLPPFIDGSCRREPDFESPFPSITATCHGCNFVSRLHEGDRIAYLTVKHKYLGDLEKGWRMVAVLRVIRRFESHNCAATWYTQQNQPPPSNCMVEGNPPKPFELTNARGGCGCSGAAAKIDFVRERDKKYDQRVDICPVFIATEADFLELNHPPQLRETQMRDIFDRIPCAQNPPKISCEQLEHLVQLANCLLGRPAPTLAR